MPYYFYDATYILVLIGALISMIASWNVKNTFRTYSRVWNSRNIPSQDIAQMILHDAGIYDVRIERIRGDLTDHYSPNEKVLRLSDSVYGSTSVAAIGVAAHECGHAIQHQEGYAPLKLRSFSVPLANIGSRLSWPIILLGLILGWSGSRYSVICICGSLSADHASGGIRCLPSRDPDPRSKTALRRSGITGREESSDSGSTHLCGSACIGDSAAGSTDPDLKTERRLIKTGKE